MPITLAFDVYGTLIDTHGVIVELGKHVGNRAHEFSRLWREKQLEYSFRRGLMLNYQDFSVCTRNALDYACLYYKIALSDVEKQELMKAYRALPPFQDARAGLEEAREEGFRLYAFSNGSADAVETVLAAASIRDYFTGVVSVDDIKTFKPSPGVYSHFLRSTGSVGSDAWLISSNPFDVIGAVSFGMRAAWIRRTPDAVFDPWGIKPTITAESLAGLAERIKRECSKA